MSGATPVTVGMAREQRLKQALFRGAGLTLQNPDYVHSLRIFMDELLRTDLQPKDLTVDALGLKGGHATAVVLAREPGVAAGLEELAFLLRNSEIDVQFEKRDGDSIAPRDALVRLSGNRMKLLSLDAWASTSCSA